MAKRINKPLALKRFMEEHPLALGFILTALDKYAKEQLEAPDWEHEGFVTQDYWRLLAQKTLEVVNADQ